MDTKIFTRIVIGLIVCVLLGLAGWYWYIKKQEQSLVAVGQARGLGTETPLFSGSRGSTLENIISGLGFQNEAVQQEEGQATPRLWRVLATPGAGHGFIASATSTTLRFVERSTGYLFETDAKTGKTTRITNNLIPQLYEAQFAGTGLPLGRRLNEENRVITSTMSILVATTTESLTQLSEKNLGDGILSVAPHPTKSEFLSLVQDGTGSTLIRSSWSGEKPTRLYTSALRGWNIFLLSDDSVYISQSAASGVPGSAFKITSEGAVPLVSRTPGLTILPRAKSSALIIGSDSGEVLLGVRGSSASSTKTLPIRTVPEKCIWAPGARAIAYCAVPQSITSSRFIDDWYRGLVHPTDSWWIVDAGAGTATPFFAPEYSGTPLDVESPMMNEAGEYIAFRNGYDKSIWLLRIATE